MALSLYDIIVPTYLQVLGGVEGALKKGQAWSAEQKLAPAELVEARLYPDMQPLRFQILSVAHHSRGAIDAAMKGVFEPPKPLDLDYAGLQSHIADTVAALQQFKPEDVNALEGRDMVFKLGERTTPFTCEGFFMSFSLPNFYFHATTGYDILRMKGVPLGKRDFLGRMRVKT